MARWVAAGFLDNATISPSFLMGRAIHVVVSSASKTSHAAGGTRQPVRGYLPPRKELELVSSSDVLRVLLCLSLPLPPAPPIYLSLDLSTSLPLYLYELHVRRSYFYFE